MEGCRCQKDRIHRKLPAELPADLQVGSKYNINNKSSTQHASSLLNPSEEGRKFFHKVNAKPTEKVEVLEPLVAYFLQQNVGLTRKEACADVVYLVDELLIPYFTAQEKFLRMKHNGRLAWLKNLLKSSHGRDLLKKAVETGKLRRLQQHQQALAEVKQNNRPLSPHEWTDPVSGVRFYEDAVEGIVTIPKEAPPRPSDTAFWNVFKKSWTF
jgi:hypothetical protein